MRAGRCTKNIGMHLTKCGILIVVRIRTSTSVVIFWEEQGVAKNYFEGSDKKMMNCSTIQIEALELLGCFSDRKIDED